MPARGGWHGHLFWRAHELQARDNRSRRACVLLAAVHGAVGSLEQGLRICAAGGERGQADADRKPGPFAVAGAASADAASQLASGYGTRFGRDHHEFVAAEAGWRIHGAATRFEDRGQADEGAIADEMAAGVIDGLQPIEVEEQ